MFNKNNKKKIFKQLAEAARTTTQGRACKYARLTDDSISYGNFVVTVRAEGYEAFRKEGDRYIPVSFHCNHDTGYRYEIWEGETYHISRREVKYEDEDEVLIFETLWNLPHVGHYAFDPDEI